MADFMKNLDKLTGFNLNLFKIKQEEFLVTKKEVVEKCIKVFKISLAEAY